jgi:hypothetical protein
MMLGGRYGAMVATIVRGDTGNTADFDTHRLAELLRHEEYWPYMLRFLFPSG